MILASTNHIMLNNNWLPVGQISIFPSAIASHTIHVICWISVCSAMASIAITFMTKPVDHATLKRFVDQVQPIGYWRNLSGSYQAERSLAKSILYFMAGSISIYAGLFGIGYLLQANYIVGISLIMTFFATLFIVIRGMRQIEQQQSQAQSTSG
jgi:hypothetical protein